MQNLKTQRANCTTPFYIRDLSNHGFWYPWRSWNQSPVDNKGKLNCLSILFSNFSIKMFIFILLITKPFQIFLSLTFKAGIGLVVENYWQLSALTLASLDENPNSATKAASSWATYLTTLCFSFLICEMGIIMPLWGWFG